MDIYIYRRGRMLCAMLEVLVVTALTSQGAQLMGHASPKMWCTRHV